MDELEAERLESLKRTMNGDDDVDEDCDGDGS